MSRIDTQVHVVTTAGAAMWLEGRLGLAPNQEASRRARSLGMGSAFALYGSMRAIGVVMPDFLHMSLLPLWEMVLRLVLAALLGFLVGFERYLKDKPLDHRPFMLVSTGSCVAVLASLELAASNTMGVSMDPTRMFNGILAGIGFLGAGAVFRSGGTLQGASTGASVWMMGGLGIACGMGAYSLAMAGAAMGILILLVLTPVTSKAKEEIGHVEEHVDDAREDGEGGASKSSSSDGDD